jgi:DNA-binding Xre family transcriptional regulator
MNEETCAHMGKSIVWRLHLVMAERRIRSVAELQRRLRDLGITISSTQLGRLHYKKPERLSVEILEGLMTVLDCTASDLMAVEEAKPAKKTPPAVAGVGDSTKGKSRVRTGSRNLALAEEDLLGPLALPPSRPTED